MKTHPLSYFRPCLAAQRLLGKARQLSLAPPFGLRCAASSWWALVKIAAPLERARRCLHLSSLLSHIFDHSRLRRPQMPHGIFDSPKSVILYPASPAGWRGPWSVPGQFISFLDFDLSQYLKWCYSMICRVYYIARFIKRSNTTPYIYKSQSSLIEQMIVTMTTYI